MLREGLASQRCLLVSSADNRRECNPDDNFISIQVAQEFTHTHLVPSYTRIQVDIATSPFDAGKSVWHVYWPRYVVASNAPTDSRSSAPTRPQQDGRCVAETERYSASQCIHIFPPRCRGIDLTKRGLTRSRNLLHARNHEPRCLRRLYADILLSIHISALTL